MSKKRLDDTAAVQGMVPYESQSEHYSRTVRKIDNGYLVRESHYGPNGPDGPTDKEVFMKNHPDDKRMSSDVGSGGAMKKAVEFMKRK